MLLTSLRTYFEKFRVKIASLACHCWVAMAFVLPFSTALTFFFSSLAALLSLFCLNRSSLRSLFSQPIAIVAATLFFWLALSALWSIAPVSELTEGLSKYRRLLFVLLIGLSFSVSNTDLQRIFSAFVVSNLIIAVLAIFIWLRVDLGFLNSFEFFKIGNPLNPTIGRTYIAQGFFLVCSATLCFWHIFNQTVRSKQILFGMCAALLVFDGVGLLQGKTGFAMLLLAGLTAIFYFVRRKEKKTGYIVMASLTGLILALLLFNSNIQSRVANAFGDANQYITHGNTNSSSGERLSFYMAGLKIASTQPLRGTCVGSFSEAYARLPNEIVEYQRTRLQPHSEAVLMLVQGGAVALLLWFLLIYLVIHTALRTSVLGSGFLGIGLAALMTLYAANGLINSVMWDLAEGHFGMLLFGCILAMGLKKRRSKS